MNDDLQTSPTLIKRIQDNDEGAWERFHEIYHSYLYCVARGMRMNHEDSIDIAQEIMLSLWKAIERYEYRPGTAKFRTWLHTVARNAVLGFIRKQRLKLSSIEDVAPQAISAYLDDIAVNQLDNIAEAEWKIFLTNQALERLKLQFRGQAIDVFLASMDGKTTAAIATRLGMNRPTVTRLKNRVRHRLTQEIRVLRAELE